MTDDARRLFFEGLVDFAGLFPPAALSMAESVRRYDEYRQGAEAWALGKFVLPVSKLQEFGREASSLPAGGDPWPLALIAGSNFAADVAAIDEFSRQAGDYARIDAIEVKAATVDDIAVIAENVSALRANAKHEFDTYVEVPVATEPGPLVAAIGSHHEKRLRAKVRTGGVESGAFPTAEQVARFLFACAAHDVTFKATAGLHHAVRGRYPLTYDRESERGVMFGFLNVFLAALFIRDGLDQPATVALLTEQSASAFAFSATGVTWRGRTVHAPAIRAARVRGATSFGSCSFAEPVADLAALGLL